MARYDHFFLLAVALSLFGCKSLKSNIEDKATGEIAQQMPGGLVRFVLPKDKILFDPTTGKGIVPADGTNGAPQTMNGIWWTNARGVHFIVSFKNAVWHADTHRATILMTGPYTYSTLAVRSTTADLEGVSQQFISTDYNGYDIEFNAAGDFGNLLMASSDRQGIRSARDAGYTMVYAADGDWVRKTTGAPDYHIRRLYDADGSVNPIIYDMEIIGLNKNGETSWVPCHDTVFNCYMADVGMGGPKGNINVNMPVDGIPSTGGQQDITVDPLAPQTYVAITGGNRDERGVVTVSPNYDGLLYVQNAKGEWISGNSKTPVAAGAPVEATADGDGRARSVLFNSGARGLVALRSPTGSNEVVTVQYTSLTALKLDETAPLQVDFPFGLTSRVVNVSPSVNPTGLYQIVAESNFPVTISMDRTDYYATDKVTTLTPNSGTGPVSTIVNFSGYEPIRLDIAVAASPGATFTLRLVPYSQTGPTVTARGVLPLDGTNVTGTLSQIDSIDVYDLQGLQQSGSKYDITPNLSPQVCCFNVRVLISTMDALTGAYVRPNRSTFAQKYLYLNSRNTQMAVMYTGDLNVANPTLNYNFSLVKHPSNALPAPIVEPNGDTIYPPTTSNTESILDQ